MKNYIVSLTACVFYTAMMFLFVVVISRCDQDKAPMMDVVLTELVSEPEPIPEIEFDINVDVEKPTIRDSIEVRDSDWVNFSAALPEDALVFDTARAAIEHESVKTYFKEAADYIEAVCFKMQDRFEPQLYLYFTNRQAREDFIAALPEGGGWMETFSIVVVGDTGYYDLYLTSTPSDCRQ